MAESTYQSNPEEEDLSQGFEVEPVELKLEPTDDEASADCKAAGNSGEAKGEEYPTAQRQEQSTEVTFFVQFESTGTGFREITVPGNKPIKDALYDYLKEDPQLQGIEKNLRLGKVFLWSQDDKVKGSPNIGCPCSIIEGGKFNARVFGRLGTGQGLSVYDDSQLQASGSYKIHLDVSDQGTKGKWITKKDPRYHSGVMLIDGLPKDTLLSALLRDGRIEQSKVKCTELAYKDESGDMMSVRLTGSIQRHDGKTFVCTVGTKPQVTEQIWRDALDRMHQSIPVKDEGGMDTASSCNKLEDRTDHTTSSSGTNGDKNKAEVVKEMSEIYIKLINKSQMKVSLMLELDFEPKQSERQENKRRKKLVAEIEPYRENYNNANIGTPVWWSNDLTRYARSVGRIVKNDRVYGTCFRVGTRYVMTNKHVTEAIIQSTGSVSGATVNFNYLKTLHQSPISFTVLDVVHTSQNELDYSVLELDIPDYMFSKVQERLTGLGHLRGPVCQQGTVTLVGHPGGKIKQQDVKCPVVNPRQTSPSVLVYLKFNQNPTGGADYRMVDHQGRATYRSVFAHGSSGSPGFDENGKLVVMHTCGYPLHRGASSVVEQGIKITAIFEDLEEQNSDLFADFISTSCTVIPEEQWFLEAQPTESMDLS